MTIDVYGDPFADSEEELAGMFPQSILRWDTGQMVLSSACEWRGMDPMSRCHLVEFDLDELVELVEADDDRAAKVERLVKKLLPEGEEPVPPKPSPEGKLRQKEQDLSSEEQRLLRDIALNEKLVTIGTERLQRAVALYTQRQKAMREIVKGIVTYDEFRGDFVEDVLSSDGAKIIPAALLDNVHSIFETIPARHTAKRRRAAVEWYVEAMSWLDRVTGKPTWGSYPQHTVRHFRGDNMSDAHIKEEWDHIIRAEPEFPLSWAKKYRLERLALNAAGSLQYSRDRIIKVQQELAIIRLKLAYPKKTKAAKAAPVLSADNSKRVGVTILGSSCMVLVGAAK